MEQNWFGETERLHVKDTAWNLFEMPVKIRANWLISQNL